MKLSDLAPKQLKNKKSEKIKLLQPEHKVEEFKQEQEQEQKYEIMNMSDYSIIDIYSNCFYHTLYSKQYENLEKLDKSATLKFIPEISILHRTQRIEKILKVQEILDKTYSKFEFEIKVTHEELSDKEITIKDYLHTDGENIIVPSEYNFIVDDILSEIEHTYQKVKFFDNVSSLRMILPSEGFKIDQENTNFCKFCEFHQICDSAKI